ncbi:baseplate assembly protein [Gluconobacter cerevisiae]|uniref:Baseplate assembly protein n=1 Tax=Gluconobacter cerevisiae TaxID=1379734 RepID=A0ABR9YFF3_9PROT|nr:baseplate assembly protein [Gluconobacter cerevisiae]MBF0877395.1 baseplate assembly protein [Gluconobacter cerevisiae]
MNDARFDAAALQGRTSHTMFGIVSAVDPVNHAVKVRIQPENIETGWIPDSCGVHAGDLRIARPSSPGTHVVLQPIEGDGEHLVVTGSVYDTVVMAPLSPLTGKVAQPGELLVKGGCGLPPLSASGKVGASSSGAGWLHIGLDGVAVGAGNASFVIKDGTIILSVGGTEMTLTSAGLTLSGGDIRTDQHSLNEHIHLAGSQKTGGPLG